jgi:Skp family chaperone for outer membrane proteins
MTVWRAFVIWLMLALPVSAQQSVPPAPPPVVIIDSERVFFETRYGQKISSDLAAQAAALQAENDQIVQDLTTEERSLTQRRATMDAAAFRAEAAAFDAKVQQVRRDRDAKTAQLQAETATQRGLFEDRVQEIIANVMLERGAMMVLEQRNVILSVRSANITDDVIARIDETLGDGTP